MQLFRSTRVPAVMLVLAAAFSGGFHGQAQTYYDNETLYSNQDPNTETRRSERFRFCFGHFNRDTGTPMTEQLAQGNLQMFEQMWHRWVVEMGLNDINESATKPDGKKYRSNFNVLMTWNDGGGGGAYSSMDANGFFYAMANSGYCRFDPPSGATPHEFGHVWEGTAAGFNGSDSSGAWWECTANWLQLQFLNTYPQAGAYIYNPMYYPAHGRDYYDSFMIWEAALEDPRYGAAWVNNVWTNANATQRVNEFIIDRMIRCDSSGSADKAGALKDLWGDMAKKMVTWDFARQRWLATVNRPDDGSDWNFYQRCRTPLVKVPGTNGWYRPARAHMPMEFGFNIIPLSVTNSTTLICNFQPLCDPVRQSDFRACLVAVNNAGEASYSPLWSVGTNSITFSAEQSKCYLVVIATPKPMKIADPAWRAYLTDAGLQFPYEVSFIGGAPRNVIYPPQNRTGMVQHGNGGGWKANSAIVDASAYVGPNAQVLNSAQVRGNARIEDFAVVKDSAQVRDNAVVSGHAMVEDNARVYGNAKVRDWGHVFGYAEVFENAKVIEHGNCGDGNSSTHTRVYGEAIVKGTTYVYDTSTFNGSLIMEGDSANGNGTVPSSKGVHFGWGWGADTARFNSLPDNRHLFAQHTFEKDNAVFGMDQFGINHAILVNGCRVAKDIQAPARGGLVLRLNGANQYAELHNGVSDFKDSTYAIWIKPAASTPDQRIWSMGDGAERVMSLTAFDSASGGLRFRITDGTLSEVLDGGAINAGVWTHVAVVFSGATCTLYVNGMEAASSGAMSLYPDSLNAPLMENANYLGRGNDGKYFNGWLDDFRAYMKALNAAEISSLYAEAAPGPVTIATDTAAPTPNAATWLVVPTAISDNAVTMSATPGSDASGWVEYYFDCTSGGGHDSGWVSFNKYNDVGITPGAPVTYTVRMRDRNGNTTASSAARSVTTVTQPLPQAAFAQGPIGIANGQITMTAVKPTNLTAKIEYKFDRTSPSPASSGWQSSPVWTQTGLTTGASCTYTVTMRNGWGNQSAVSAPATAVARDDAAPMMPIPVAHWEMLPYATIDNRISMTAMPATDAAGIEYQFHCVSGGGPDSPWQSGRTFLTPVLPDGTYVYEYRVRDNSTQRNTSGYSRSYPAKITPTSGYHAYTLAQVVTQPDDYLVSFPATVLKVYSNNYYVKDLMSGASIKVRPSTSNQVTDASLALKNVTVKGHLYTFGGNREVTFATVAAEGNPTLYTVSGKVTNVFGAGVAGATVYFADVPNASSNAIVTATTDASGNFSKGLLNGQWYVSAGASAYNTSADRVVAVNGASLQGINFGLVANARVSGKVVRRTDGTALTGASVYFSRSSGASGSPVFTATTDIAGNFTQAVQDGTWYVSAGSAGFYAVPDKLVTVRGADVGYIDFALLSNARNIPNPSDLLFSVITDSLPASGNTGPWPTYLPAGKTLSPLGSPSVEILDGVKWEKNVYTEADGYNQARYATPLIANGITIIAAVRPVYQPAGGEPRGEIVDIFYDRLALAISHADGRLMVARGYWNDWGPAIPNRQKTIVSLVVQPDGSYAAFTNGVQVMDGGPYGDYTSIPPDHSVAWGSYNPWANDPDFTHYISVGRNAPDGWSTFNGNIGDVFVYTNALADADRIALETDLSTKFLSASDYTITATVGSGGYINPSGAVLVPPGGQQTFTMAALAGYSLTNVVVDGVSQGIRSSYTFSNVNGNRNIAAYFAAAPVIPPTLMINATAGGLIEITWPDTYKGQLLSAPALGAGAVWAPVGVTPVQSGGTYKVTITPGNNAVFYGLSK